ncbi:Cupredoxin [Kalaharituber pfeilii]|nr:Cupredoxin [Kalaharituber pfeilii]
MARFFLRPSFIWGAILVGKAFVSASPTYSDKFSIELPIPPVLQPLTSYTPTRGNPIDFYEVSITPFKKQLWPGLEATKLVGYNGIYPGPTIKATRGREIVLRVVNQGDANAAVHLHGSATVAPFDGWASDLIAINEYKDYYYPNFQEGRTLWYHDHAHKETESNVGKGQAGLYIIEDPTAEASLNLPCGNYDVPLVLASKKYDTSGQLVSGSDTIEVNGQLWPYFEVEPRKYRFRVLNGAATRTFTLRIHTGNTTTDPRGFQVIASDSGFLTSPVSTTDLRISAGERYEIVMDFADYAGQTLTLRNAEGTALTSETLGQIMQFRVGRTISDDTNNGDVPSTLRTINFLPMPTTTPKNFTFEFANGVFTINGVTFSDVNNRVLNNVPRGTIEIWNLINTGAGVHPVHNHLVEFQIISRTIGGVQQTIPAYEAAALKDIAILNGQESVQVLAKYAPWDGLYMFHCHNLVHEDGEMMAAFNVTALENFGYSETTRFLNPEDSRWAAQRWTGKTDLKKVLSKTLPEFKALHAYDDIEGLMEALDEYHSTR